MDISLGQLNLNIAQKKRAESLHSSNVNGFTFWESGEVIVTSKRILTEAEKAELIDKLQGLSSDPLPPTRLEELKAKPALLDISEINEVLRLLILR